MAVIRKFTVRLAFIDMAWGSFVTAVLSGFVYWVGKKNMTTNSTCLFTKGANSQSSDTPIHTLLAHDD